MKSTELQFPADCRELSTDCKDLCQKLLRRNPGKHLRLNWQFRLFPTAVLFTAFVLLKFEFIRVPVFHIPCMQIKLGCLLKTLGIDLKLISLHLRICLCV